MILLLSKCRRFCWIAFGLIVMAGCGAAAPSPVDSYQITVGQDNIGSTEAENGQYRISGGPGSVPSTSTVTITNTNPQYPAPVTVSPATDGSFTALISASRGDRLSIVVKDQSGNSSLATVVYVGMLNIKNPYMSGGYWYTGQTHFHTNYTDGKNTAAQMEAAYYDRGYDFLVSTDHRGTAPWFILPIHGNTPDPDNAASGKNLLWISGTELGFGDVHMGAWGAPLPSTVYTGTQNKIDEVRKNGGLIAINHPHNDDPVNSWDWGTETRLTQRFSFVEAFNGKHVSGKNGWVGEKNHIPTAIDLADEFRQVWWIGTDDCHDKDDPLQFDRYAVVVQTDSNVINQGDLLSFADMGSLYIRQTARGPVLSSVTTEGNVITLTMEDIDSNYHIFWMKRGNEIVKSETVNTTSAYTVQGNEGYVRAEIQRVSDELWAYTQPMFIANNVDLATAVTVSGGSGGQTLIDNNRNTFWQAPSGTSSFVVDVGKVRLVNAIKIGWFTGDSRRFNYKIETSDTGVFAGEQVEVVRETYDNRSASTLDFFDEAAKYVKVTITSLSVESGVGLASTVRINEVQVFDASPARTHLYVDNVRGDDGNPGWADSPWRSFDYARSRARPRDTVHLVNAGIPYPGMMELRDIHSGKHPMAMVRYEGDKNTLTQVNAAGSEFGARLNGTEFVEWMYFDIYSAVAANMVVFAKRDNVVMYNRLHDAAAHGLFGAGKFTMAYNLIYRNAMEGAFIYNDNAQVKIYNNVFYGNGDVGLSFHNQYEQVPPVAEVMNNISAGNAGVALRRGTPGTITDGHNCVDGAYEGPWQRTASIDGDPLFVNPQAGDFRLQAGSPCIDAGIDVGLSADFLGNPPRDAPLVPNSGDPGSTGKDYIDIGAYEYVD